jgi:hypothetical protein
MITSSCVSASPSMSTMLDPQCPTASITGSSLKVTGTVVYKADMTYSSNATVSGSVTVTLPASCLMTMGITITCDQLNQVFAANPTIAPGAHCSPAGGGACACAVNIPSMASAEMGTYTTTAAGLLTETPTGGATTQSDYCVKGNTLTDSPHAGASMMGTPVSGTITLQKQ